MRTLEDLKKAFAGPAKSSRNPKEKITNGGKPKRHPYTPPAAYRDLHYVSAYKTPEIDESRVVYRDKPLSDTETHLKAENERLNAIIDRQDEIIDKYMARFGRL